MADRSFHAGRLRVQHIANSSCGFGYGLAAGSVSLARETFGGDRRHFATRVTTSGDGIGAFENVWTSWPDWPFSKPAFRH